MHGHMHGCGVALRSPAAWSQPTGAAASDSVGPGASDQRFQGVVLARLGKFFVGEHVGAVMACSDEASHAAAVEADVAAQLARSWSTPLMKDGRLNSKEQQPQAMSAGLRQGQQGSSGQAWRWPWQQA
jgi:hypothetical protein